jgi:Tol biopolymer transport system component
MIPFLLRLTFLLTLILTALAVLLHVARQEESTAFRLAYVEATHGSQSVFTMDFNGQQRRRLTDDFGDDFAPAWSPNNDYIAFYSFRGLSATVYLVPPTGGSIVELALSFGSGIEPQWSPGGDYLVFERFTTRGSRDIMLYHPATQTLSRLDGPGGRNFAPAWSPRGHELIFVSTATSAETTSTDTNAARTTRSQQLYLADARFDDAPGEQVTRGEGVFRSASWLPDGRRFVASAVYDGNEDLYLLDLDGNIARRLTTDAAVDTSPQVAPTGAYVAFISDRISPGRKQLYILDLHDPAAVPELRSDAATTSDVTGRISWSGGGEWLAFTAIDADTDIGSVYRTHVSGRDLRRLTDPTVEAGAPTFSPGIDRTTHVDYWWAGALLTGVLGVWAVLWRRP